MLLFVFPENCSFSERNFDELAKTAAIKGFLRD